MRLTLGFFKLHLGVGVATAAARRCTSTRVRMALPQTGKILSGERRRGMASVTLLVRSSSAAHIATGGGGGGSGLEIPPLDEPGLCEAGCDGAFCFLIFTFGALHARLCTVAESGVRS